MRVLICVLVLLCTGCATYVTPGGAAPLEQLNRADVATGSLRQPAPQFPASVAIVRVQAAPYRSFSSRGQRDGRFSVADARDAATAEQLQLVGKWPATESADVLNTAWLPEKLESIDDLRSAAAKMQADVLLVYTINTTFQLQGHDVSPDGTIPLGDRQTGPAAVAASVSAVFVDVRTGFVYGRTESKTSADVSDLLRDGEALDHKRIAVERGALTVLLSTTGKTIWTELAQQYQ